MIENSLIRRIYLYSFAFLGLVLMVIGAVRLLDLGLKVYVFKQADQYAIYPYPAKIDPEATSEAQDIESNRVREEEARKQNTTSQRQSAASSSIAMIVVGMPLFFYHWRKVNAKG